MTSFVCEYQLPTRCGSCQTNYAIWRDTEAEARLVAVQAVVEGAWQVTLRQAEKPVHTRKEYING